MVTSPPEVVVVDEVVPEYTGALELGVVVSVPLEVALLELLSLGAVLVGAVLVLASLASLPTGMRALECSRVVRALPPARLRSTSPPDALVVVPRSELL
jgi:hypothetical protein